MGQLFIKTGRSGGLLFYWNVPVVLISQGYIDEEKQFVAFLRHENEFPVVLVVMHIHKSSFVYIPYENGRGIKQQLVRS